MFTQRPMKAFFALLSWQVPAAALLAALLMPAAAEAGCGINVGAVTASSIEIRYDSTSCKSSRDGIVLCLKKAWDTVGACNGGTKVSRPGKKGAYTFHNLAPDTAYKIKVRYRRRNRWAQLGKTTPSTRPASAVSTPCGEITNPVLSGYTGDSVKVSFHSGGASCNPTAFLVQAKYWYQKWLDGAVFNTGSGQFGTNNLVLKGIVEGLVALGIVPEENKDQVMKKLESLQGTGHKYVALAGSGKKHQVTLGGLSGKRRYYIRVFNVDAEGNVSSTDTHTAKTPSKGVFKTAGVETEWTEWLDRDDPGGAGDYETLKDLAQAVLTCEEPLAIECRTKDGRDWREAGQVYRCDKEVGGVCVNAQQAAGGSPAVGDPRPQPQAGSIRLRQAPRASRRVAGSACLDYEVRFLCPAP